MSVDPDLLTLTQVCSRLPGARGAPRVHTATITRWILTGARAVDGRRVKLTATRCGSRWLVNPADLDAFFVALATKPPAPTALQTRSPAARRHASEAAARELDDHTS